MALWGKLGAPPPTAPQERYAASGARLIRRLCAQASLLLALLLAPFPSSAQGVVLTPTPVQHFVDNNGNSCSGCEVFTYGAGTTSKVATYTDSTGATPNTNPIILNTRGEAGIWLTPGQAYKFVFAPAGSSDPPTAPIWTVDNITSGASSVVAVSSITALKALTVGSPGTVVNVTGYATPGDMPADFYRLVHAGCGIGGGDGGSQIPSNTSGWCWYLLPQSQIDDRNFGAKNDCTTDDTTAVQNAVNYAASLAPYSLTTSTGFRPVVTWGGLCSFISATIVVPATNGIRLTSGVLKANPATNWSGTYPNGMIDAEVNNNVLGIAIDHLTLDGSQVASGMTMIGHGASGHGGLPSQHYVVRDNYLFHVERFGILGVGIRTEYNFIQELFSGDTNYNNYPSGYTTNCLWLDGGADGQYIGDTEVDCLQGITVGDSGGGLGDSTSNLLMFQHPWHGAAVTNPVDIAIYGNSRGNIFTDTYLDNGIVQLYSTANKFLGIHPTYSVTTLTAFFQMIATSASQSLDSFSIYPPNQSYSIAPIPWFNCTAASGGDNWNVNALVCGSGGLGTGSAQTNTDITIGVEPNNLVASGTVAGDFYTDASSGFIQITPNFSGAQPAFIGQDANTNNVYIGNSNIAASFAVNSNGHIAVVGANPTCSSGCGSPGVVITGSDSVGTVTLGTSPSASFDIHFVNAFLSTPSCQVQEYNNGSGITSISPTTTDLTVTPQTPTAGTRFTWHCWEVMRG